MRWKNSVAQLISSGAELSSSKSGGGDVVAKSAAASSARALAVARENRTGRPWMEGVGRASSSPLFFSRANRCKN